MDFMFNAWTSEGNNYRVGIEKISNDKAVISINNDRYDVSHLKKDASGTIMKGSVRGFSVTLQIICNPNQQIFSIRSFPLSKDGSVETIDFSPLYMELHHEINV